MFRRILSLFVLPLLAGVLSADVDYWQPANDLDAVVLEDGVIRARSTGGDPFFMADGVSIDPATVSEIVLRMRSSASGFAEFFWASDEPSPPAADAAKKQIPINNNIFIGDGTAGPTRPSGNLMKNTSPKKGKRVIGYGTWLYDDMPTPLAVGGNVYYHGAGPAENEADPVVVEENPAFKIIEQVDQVFLEITLSPEQAKANTELVTTELLGKAQIPDLPYLDHDGSPIRIANDYFGQPRDPQNPTPGPFENPPAGRVKLQVW
jgi:hypothetical protein